MSAKWKIVVPLRAGGVRKYTCASRNAAEKRLADHKAMVASLGTSELYYTAYIQEPNGREVYITG
jgi:hypothetical protein